MPLTFRKRMAPKPKESPAEATHIVSAASRRRKRAKGAEVLEFTLAFLPLLAITFALLDVSWAFFAKSTLQYAVRTGVRTGITITGTQATAANGCLADMVKATVQRNSLGILAGSSGLSKIKVNFFDATGDVTSAANANAALHVMQVSVQGYSLRALIPRVYGWRQPVDNSATILNASSADLIEPGSDIPCIGVVP
ncbi:MAG TPA: TadE/TadG family type IV pilus assembly protein [Candidatus Acidoferrum sp.]|nr:TadE/TadG family type IV pilus assembly protein [Candidatus Acidoferrum sp.]